MTLRWGVYCSREHKTLKYTCEFCNGDCDEELLEPPFDDEYVEGETVEYSPVAFTNTPVDCESEIDDIPF